MLTDIMRTQFTRQLPRLVGLGVILSIPTSYAQPIAPPTCDYGAAHENAPEQLEQFSFLIGDYSITLHRWLGENWSPALPGSSARWNGRYALGGMAIADEWFNPDPAQDLNANRGINVRMFDPEADEWDMMWLDTTSNQVSDLRAKIIDGTLTMWQVSPERENFKAEFFIDDKDHWKRIQYTRTEQNEWQPLFSLNATRIACPD